jgi:hypothetical protein
MEMFDTILSTRADPLSVLTTTASVVQHARDVKIDHRRIEKTADELAARPFEIPAWNFEYHFFDGTAKTLTYLLLLDALNFSFWGEPKWSITFRGKSLAKLDGYWALAAALKRAILDGIPLTDADFLAQISPTQLADILRGSGKAREIPLFIERWRNARQVGVVLRERFGGDAARLVESAQRDAPRLARLVVDNFASFDDVTIYDGRAVRFFKRAQIFVADVWGSFGGKGWGEFTNLDALTAFADYKLPQILRAWEILKYSASLARKVDRKVELRKDSPEETEIRAAMLWAVEFLREALSARGRKLSSVQMDWFLWQASQARVEGMRPYYRVRTIYY